MTTKLLIIVLILFSSSAQLTASEHLETKNHVIFQTTHETKKENSVQKNILFKLMEQTIVAYRYWENYQLTAKIKLIDISIDKKQFFLQDADVEIKKEALLLIQKRLAHAINKMSTLKEFTSDSFAAFTDSIVSELETCDIPSIIKRNWLGCTVGAIGIGCAAYLYKKSLGDYSGPDNVATTPTESPLTEIYTSFFKKPFQNVKELLLVELPKQKLAALDLEKTMGAPLEEEKLNIVAQAYTAYLNGNTAFASIFQTTNINNLSKEQIDTIINEQVDTIISDIPGSFGIKSFFRIVNDITDTTINKIWSFCKFQKLIPLVSTPTYTLSTINYQKNNVKFGIASLRQILAKVEIGKQLTVESLKLSLGVGSLFAAKKATYHCLGWTYEQAVIEPLVADLNDYSYFLQTQKIDHCSDSAYFNGMNIYWTTRLAQYTPKINPKHRVEFNRKMALLASFDITLEHRIDIVQSILDSQCLR